MTYSFRDNGVTDDGKVATGHALLTNRASVVSTVKCDAWTSTPKSRSLSCPSNSPPINAADACLIAGAFQR